MTSFRSHIYNWGLEIVRNFHFNIEFFPCTKKIIRNSKKSEIFTKFVTRIKQLKNSVMIVVLDFQLDQR